MHTDSESIGIFKICHLVPEILTVKVFVSKPVLAETRLGTYLHSTLKYSNIQMAISKPSDKVLT